MPHPVNSSSMFVSHILESERNPNRVVDPQSSSSALGPWASRSLWTSAAAVCACTLIERNTSTIQLPKMERCNARTMEIYRRLGIAERVRDAGLPRNAPMDVFLALSMADPPLAHLPCPSVAEAKAEIAAHNDGGFLSRIS